MTWKCTNTPKGENKLYSDAKGVVPSLDLRFAEGKTLNDYMTATPLVGHQRSMSGSNLSPGTFVNSSGLIETANTNLTRYSNFELGWPGLGISLSPNYSSPDGLSNASLLSESAATSLHYLNRSDVSVTAGITYCFSVYYKKGTGATAPQWMELSVNFAGFGGGNAFMATFDIENGLKGSAGSSIINFDIIDAGNGWYRCWMTAIATATTTTSSLVAKFNNNQSTLQGYVPYTGQTTSDVFVFGAQIEEGSFPTTYIPTTDVPSAAPRFDHDPTTGESLGLLIEESRTNLLLQSEDFSTTWTSAAPYAVTTNATVAPNGQQTADAIIIDSGQSSFNINVVRQSIVKAASALTYTHSAYYKALGATTSVRIVDYGANTTDNVSVVVSLANGSIIGNPLTNGAFSQGSASVTTLNDGWYRVSVTFTSDTATSLTIRAFPYVGLSPLVGDGTSGIYIWGAQLEVGSFPTSYIPTTGTALTRNVDVASITGSNFSSWYNQTEGTIFTEAQMEFALNTASLFPNIYESGIFPNRLWSLYLNKAAGNQLRAGTGDAINRVLQTFSSSPQAFKVAQALSNSVLTYSVSKDGATPLTGSLGKSITNTTSIRIGAGDGAVKRIARLTYFPERLPDSTLQTITQ